MKTKSPRARKPTQKPSLARPTQNASVLRWHCWTDKGKVRANNEDSFLGLRFDANELHRLGKVGEASNECMDFTFAVSDGMGGANAGEFASRIAVEKITMLLPRAFSRGVDRLPTVYSDATRELFRQIHRALGHLGQSYDECRGMETTMSLCWFTLEKMNFAHVGDSRIYHLPAGQDEARQLTEDDTHVAWLLRQGMINEREARTHPRRNVLQKALGGENQFVQPQTGEVTLARGDIFLLCSDGLAEGLYNHQMVDVLRASRNGDAQFNPARNLVETSVRNDGHDNVTALVVEVV
jgi:protein phosphatase